MRKILFALLTFSALLVAQESKLKYVIDGDTVVFKSETCRLAYIDTPESKRNSKATRDIANCSNVTLDDIVQSGRYAKRYLKSIMQKGKVYRFDIISKDRYGRSVCVIYDDSDGRAINEKIVTNGFAVPYWKYINKADVTKVMRLSVGYAAKNNKGLWRTNLNVLMCMSRKVSK